MEQCNGITLKNSRWQGAHPASSDEHTGREVYCFVRTKTIVDFFKTRRDGTFSSLAAVISDYPGAVICRRRPPTRLQLVDPGTRVHLPSKPQTESNVDTRALHSPAWVLPLCGRPPEESHPTSSRDVRHPGRGTGGNSSSRRISEGTGDRDRSSVQVLFLLECFGRINHLFPPDTSSARGASPST